MKRIPLTLNITDAAFLRTAVRYYWLDHMMTKARCDALDVRLKAAINRAPKLQRELFCEICGHEYVVWFAPNELWNRVVRPSGEEEWQFLCPTCFTKKADERGVEYTAFEIRVERPEGSPMLAMRRDANGGET